VRGTKLYLPDSGGDGTDRVECGQRARLDGKGNVLINGTNILGEYSRTWYPKTQLIKID
jgi:hypothetical protein